MADSLGDRITGLENVVQEFKGMVERRQNMGASSGNHTHVTFQGLGNVAALLVVGMVSGVCLGLAVAIAVWVSSAFNRQDSMNNWTAQEVTAIRSYITNGKLQPMAPRPMSGEPFNPDPKPEK